MLNFHQSLPFLNWLFPSSISYKIFPQQFLRFSHKIFLQEFPARFSRNNFPQDFPTRFSHKIFPQDFPIRISRKIFLQNFPKLDTDWLAPHHTFPNANFHQSLHFLNWLFPLLHFPQDFPARISRKNFPQDFPTRISRKNFPQDFPARISHKNFPQDFPARFSRAGS